MKIRLELDGSITEDEVVIRCRTLSGEVQMMQKTLADLAARNQRFVFYKGDKEYYLPLEDILFFETEGKVIFAHTGDSGLAGAGGTADGRTALLCRADCRGTDLKNERHRGQRYAGDQTGTVPPL